MSENDWGVMPLANPSDISDDPRLRGQRIAFKEDGSSGTLVAQAPDTTEGEGASFSSHSRGGRGGMVNMADAERARAQAIWAAKEAAAAEHYSKRQGLAGTSPVAPRAPTPDELYAKAMSMMDQVKAQGALSPALSDRDDSGKVLPSWLKESAGR